MIVYSVQLPDTSQAKDNFLQITTALIQANTTLPLFTQVIQATSAAIAGTPGKHLL